MPATEVQSRSRALCKLGFHGACACWNFKHFSRKQKSLWVRRTTRVYASSAAVWAWTLRVGHEAGPLTCTDIGCGTGSSIFASTWTEASRISASQTKGFWRRKTLKQTVGPAGTTLTLAFQNGSNATVATPSSAHVSSRSQGVSSC